MKYSNAHCSKLVLAALVLLAPVAHATDPKVTLDSSSSQIARFSKDPLARSYLWHCNDPDGQVPLQHQCITKDITVGGTTSGTVLEDVNCGSSSVNPSSISHNYTIPSPISEHHYGYGITCTDSMGEKYILYHVFWYDITKPTTSVVSGPPSSTTSSSADFQLNCTDNSYNLQVYGNPAACFFYCTLEYPDGSKKPAQCGKATSVTPTISWNYSGLTAPGSYTLSVFASDEAGNFSTTKTYSWTILGPDGGTPDAAPLDGNSADSGLDAQPADAGVDAQLADAAADAATGDLSADASADSQPADSATADSATADSATITDSATPDAMPIDSAAADSVAAIDTSAADATAQEDTLFGDSAQGDAGPAGADSGGCSCRVTASPATPASLLLLLLALVALTALRRRGRRG